MDIPAQAPPSRRQALKALWLATWATLVAALGLATGAVLRLIGSGQQAPAGPVALGNVKELAGQEIMVRQGLALLSDQGGLYALVLTCPHLGCQPAWHQASRRFLCPCHGSSFAPDGSRLSGPALTGLTHAALEADAQGNLTAYPDRRVEPATRLKLG